MPPAAPLSVPPADGASDQGGRAFGHFADTEFDGPARLFVVDAEPRIVDLFLVLVPVRSVSSVAPPNASEPRREAAVVMSVFRGGGGGLGIESDDLYIFLFEGAVRSCAQSESASCAECGEVLLRRADQLLLVAVVGGLA